ncbi:MAG TPA: CDP-diacylglycerol O-phosphatidyltransferase [Candidatus Binatia bacterium]|nr:CDP-diacylglycerol O-phosphatidyltransferase [Candidatus Binatia bacterium]
MPVLLAWLVHVYSAVGVLLGFLSVLLVERGEYRSALWLNALAVVIDASDGTFARAARVKERIPRFDGARLEDIVDYLNYVLVPSLILFHAGLLPPDGARWIAAAPMLASAYGFCQKDAKTSDNYFLGFPSYWNILVLYLLALRTPAWLNTAIVLFLAAMVFVPIRYIYPSRTAAFQRVTVALGIVWGVLVALTLYYLPDPPREIVYASLLFPLYYALLSFFLSARTRSRRGEV